MKKPTPTRKPKQTPEIAALQRAAKQALELAIRTGTPCHVWQDGKIVDIAAPARKRSVRKSRKRAGG